MAQKKQNRTRRWAKKQPKHLLLQKGDAVCGKSEANGGFSLEYYHFLSYTNDSFHEGTRPTNIDRQQSNETFNETSNETHTQTHVKTHAKTAIQHNAPYHAVKFKKICDKYQE